MGCGGVIRHPAWVIAASFGRDVRIAEATDRFERIGGTGVIGLSAGDCLPTLVELLEQGNHLIDLLCIAMDVCLIEMAGHEHV